MSAPSTELAQTSRRLPPTVIALGWVSFLTDAASDMIYPLIPAFLLTLGGGAVAIGWLEGVSEALGAVLKLVSGAAADRPSRRKPLIALGYGISALTRPLLAFATAPLHAVLVRAVDRVGKGLRGPPRDAMVADAAPPEMRGHAFGYHRMMDNAGAVAGSLLAFALLRFLELDLRAVFRIAVIPGLLAVVVALVFVRPPRAGGPSEAPAVPPGKGKPRPTLAAGPALPPAARRYLLALAIFSLGASGDMFLVLRLLDLGLPRSLVPIVWMSLQLGKAALNVPGGKAGDRHGRRRVLVIAWGLYAASYAALGLVGSWPLGWAVLGLYACHYGLAEGGQRALLAELVPSASLGRAFGLLLAVEGAMVLPANVLFGLVYARLGAGVAFGLVSGLALAGALVLSTVQTRRSAV